MRSRHLVTSGNRFRFVVRVPSDIIDLFPSGTIWKPIKACNIRAARLLASCWEYRTQQLFLALRTRMIPKELEKLIIATFLRDGTDALEARAKGQQLSRENGSGAETEKLQKTIDAGFEALASLSGLNPREARGARAAFLAGTAGVIEEDIAERDTSLFTEMARSVADKVSAEHGIVISEKDVADAILPLMNAQKKLLLADNAVVRGDWDPMERLRQKSSTDLATPTFDLRTVFDRYREYFLASKSSLKPGTLADMEVELRTLLEILGNISIREANRMESVTKLKAALKKYPLNRVQRYGNRSLQDILRNETGYRVINAKTANQYISRMGAVITYANKSKMLDSQNVYTNERFEITSAAEEERLPYSGEDIERLIDALCTKPLWGNGQPRPERFWIILISLMEGLRLGNTVALTKADICRTDKGIWVFNLRHGKTKSTVRLVPICDALLLLGFLEWVAALPHDRLFWDTSRTFSAWYNRHDEGFLGFEPRYVTQDKKKCLYSIRHTFAGNVMDVTKDSIIVASMLGHSTEHNVTARYAKARTAERLKEIAEKMSFEHIDLDRLEARAKELFHHI